MIYSYIASLLLQCLLLSTFVSANTEIVNFRALLSDDVDVVNVSQWLEMNTTVPEHYLEVRPNPRSKSEDVWVVLNLDSQGWATYDAFTLRVSWPASHPADFTIRTYTPAELYLELNRTSHSKYPSSKHSANINLKTRNQYARIRVADSGIRNPSLLLHENTVISFIVTLEPLHFGLLPASLIPTIVFLVPLILLSGFVVFPAVYQRLHLFANQAREDMTSQSRKIQ